MARWRPHRLVGGVEAALRARIGGGDAGRAGVAVALRAWMQPSANMKPRAVTTTSAPRRGAQATLPGTISLPEAITRTARAARIDELVDIHHRQRLRSDRPTMSMRWLRNAPVPPSGAIHGDEVGRGFDAAAIADFRSPADRASRSGRSPS